MSAVRAADACSSPFRVRFDEAGPDGLLRTSAVLRYAQDLAWFHSSARGYTRSWYAEGLRRSCSSNSWKALAMDDWFGMVIMRIQRPSTRIWFTALKDCDPPLTCITASVRPWVGRTPLASSRT